MVAVTVIVFYFLVHDRSSTSYTSSLFIATPFEWYHMNASMSSQFVRARELLFTIWKRTRVRFFSRVRANMASSML